MEIENVLGGVPRILMDLRPIRRADTQQAEVRNQSRNLRPALQRRDPGKLASERSQIQLLQRGLVHEAGIQLNELALIRIGRIRRLR
jgi:hypothetical protein